MTELRVTVFERRRGTTVEWHTVGLGDLDRVERGPSALRLQQRLADGLRKALASRWPQQLAPIEFVPGRQLHAVALDLTLGSAGRRFHDKVPLVLEPRARGGIERADPLWIAYHPMRSREWFPHAPDRNLADEAAAFFRSRWAELPQWQLDRMRASPRDALRLLALQVRTRSLFDRLAKGEQQPGGFAALGQAQRKRGAALLEELGVDQTALAADDALPRGSARSPWREQLQQLVCGNRRSSVLLVGPSGCGKSTLLRGAVHDLLEADGWSANRNLDLVHAVWHIRGHRIIAGMAYLGQWEQRCLDLLEACRSERALLWVDDLHAWGRIGESRESDRSLATFFRGPIARGEMTVLGECSPEQYQMLLDDAPELAAAFTVLWVEPTNDAETAKLVQRTARTLELEHHVAFAPSAFRTIAELGGALSPTTVEPGRSIALLGALGRGEHGFALELESVEQELAQGRKLHAIRRYRELTGCGLAAAHQAVTTFETSGMWPAVAVAQRPAAPSPRSTLDAGFSTLPQPPTIGAQAVVRLLAARTGVPELLLVPQRALAAEAIAAAFAAQIIGQPRAIDAIVDVVLRMRTQTGDRARPYGVLLLSGPTGTGKTELAKCLAEYLYGDVRRLVRLDMSEYAGPDAPARLIGDRFRPEGTLTQVVRAQPFCVVLLDEIDKADPSILALMLQVFDDGRLTDAAGHVVDFSHAVVLLTSNLGAGGESTLGLGGRGGGDVTRELERAVREFFPPELFNRIDRIVPFDPLTAAAATRIAARELEALLGRAGLVERNVFVRFTPAVVDHVVARGFAARDGARSLKRWLEDHVGAWLADEIASGPIAALRVLWLYVRDGALALHAEHLVEATVQAAPGAMQALLQWDARRLRQQVPEALARVEALLDGEALARLAASLRATLPPSLAGDRSAAEAAYNLENLRGELLDLRERLRLQAEYDPLLDDGTHHEIDGALIEAQQYGWDRRVGEYTGETYVRSLDPRALVPELPLRTRGQVLVQLAELRALERAIGHADDVEEHVVLVELSRVSRARADGRFGHARASLLEWLACAYAGARGSTDEIVAVLPGGTRSLGVTELAALDVACERMVLRISGPGVRSFFAVEDGCHVRHGLSGASEVVRVRVSSGRDRSAAEHVASLQRRREQFAAALEHGDRTQLPDNPDAVPPIVRAYHFEPNPTHEPARIEVEDFPIAFVLRGHVARLAEILPTLWMLRPDPPEAP